MSVGCECASVDRGRSQGCADPVMQATWASTRLEDVETHTCCGHESAARKSEEEIWLMQ